ncbi:hypothetical protein B0H14DRAFT_2699699 [Mycena olivaceomarginata]|uniref:Uncharacterized protein n=1 Tax=Mycena albidolilacea TaxID=1033008 RepID=A0AAD6ZGW6_9AGAR|nr:hypothetical protein DFH08DRAFT_888093 [Mycena albidolilacea]KAJ7885103.1 hypothetical protein B0H14DRAFT_2699699 [Mycena olivaceomarginata]
MSVATPTVLPRPLLFPRLLPKPPSTHPAPLPPQGKTYGRLNASRNLGQEMEDLSDEETELEDMNIAIRHRGFATLIPIGRNLTQQEEKNDAEDDDDDESDSAPSNGPPSVGEDVGENSTQDLDASMEDMDENEEEDDEDDSEDEEEVEEVEESSEV